MQSDRYLTESELKFKVGGQGVNADINLKTKTIVQSENNCYGTVELIEIMQKS
ncbi:hypothetical protein [Dolichospermum sp. UHCC 0259]|uniref:hypothetical protein n=1 Tax=Dolichospermum sp. UHCC 0259 TaxID=2590010 RepID=UPI001446E6E4|nr:hypothetical protein [Dolichospermum sp. UHCC 0259]